MQKNRLIQLQRYSSKPTEIGSKLKQSLVTQSSDTGQTDDVSYCKGLIKSLQNLIFEMNQMKKDYSRVTRSGDQRQIMHKVNGIVKKGNMHINDLQKTTLKINEQVRAEKQAGNSSNVVQCTSITRKANNAIKEYTQAQQKFTSTVRNTIKRQATILKRQQISEQQVDQMVNNPQIAQNMLKQKLLNAPSSQLENAVSDIIDKCKDIIKLERNVHECVQMMKELAILTQIQGEQINTIQGAIQQTKDYVEKGQVKLVSAKTYYKKSQKVFSFSK